MKEELLQLAERVERGEDISNSLDIEVEIALFEPDNDWSAIRPNAAGTKVICTTPDGTEKTFWAVDWTMDRRATAAALRARAAKEQSK